MVGYNKHIERFGMGGNAHESSARAAAAVDVWSVPETAAHEKKAVRVGAVTHDGAEEPKRHIPHSG